MVIRSGKIVEGISLGLDVRLEYPVSVGNTALGRGPTGTRKSPYADATKVIFDRKYRPCFGLILAHRVYDPRDIWPRLFI